MGIDNVLINSKLTPAEQYPFEIVERKGIGHPDTLADGVAEAISLEYSKYCLKNYGVILHQTLDKIMLIGGLGKFGFGIGKMIQPWRLILNGRLTKSFERKKVPYQDIEIDAARKYLKLVVPKLDINKWLKIEMYTSSYSKNPRWFAPRSIKDIPDAIRPYANDTSTCVGYWPLTITEQLTLLMERYFYDSKGLTRFNYIGQDIKVMSVRRKDKIVITMCVPFFSQFTPDCDTYYGRKKRIITDLLRIAREFVKNKYEISLQVNTQDEMIGNKRKSIGYYFVVSGSALDSGEEGVVGRGNRSRGIISTVRPHTLEAIQGKNPVYYVGKVYNYLADILAKKIATQLECESVVYISSRNGDDLYKPHQIFVHLSKKRDHKQMVKVIEEELTIHDWTKRIIEDKAFLPFPGGGNGYNSPNFKLFTNDF